MASATSRWTSRIFQAMSKWLTALELEDWPAHPVTGETVSVTLSDADPTLGAEAVIISVADNESALEWARLSKPGRTEVFTLRAVIRSNVRGVANAIDVLDRLEVLADVVQESLFDTTTTGQPVLAIGFDGERYGQISTVAPDVDVNDDGGWYGTCVVEATFTADI